MAAKNVVALYNLNFLSLFIIIMKKRIPKKRRFWIRDIFRKRSRFGLANTWFQNCDHMTTDIFCIEAFSVLLRLIECRIAKKNTRWRESISTHDRLCLTLRFFGKEKHLEA